MPPLTPQQRSMRASIAAHTRWSQEHPAENAARGQAGLLGKFEREIRAAAARAEREKAEALAASNPDPAVKLNPLGAGEREGVPLWLWRGAGT